MIPAGYVDSIIAWATRPDLRTDEKSARQTTLLDEQDRLITGQLTGKAGKTLISGSANGKAFTWAPEVLASEKTVVITAVLRRLGLLAADSKLPGISFANFSCLER